MTRSVAILILLALGACASSDRPAEVKSDYTYKEFTREFLWEQLALELRESWKLGSVDHEKHELVTEWGHTELAPFNTFGRRHQLTVRIVGDVEEGFQIEAEQRTEKNTNEENPLSHSEADWSGMESDGVLAEKLLTRLHRRLHPSRPWLDENFR